MRTKTLASGAAALCLSEVVIAVVLVVTLGWSWQETLDSFVLSNGAIGISFGLCGALIAWHRPRHPIGWMYALSGTLQSATALTAPLAAILQNHGAPTWLVRLDLTVFNNAWPGTSACCFRCPCSSFRTGTFRPRDGGRSSPCWS